MDIRRKKVMLTAAGLAVIATVLSCYAWIQIKKLSLPCPLAIPILNFIVPTITFLLILSGSKIAPHMKQASLPAIMLALTSASTFLPLVLAVLSTVYAVPSDLLACAGDLRWKSLFHTKNAAAIQAIQNQFRCCGYNSVNDRAWPFPAREITADTCARTLNFTVRCADFWHRRESFVAGILGFASLLNWMLLVILATSIQNGPGWLDHVPIGNRRPNRLLTEASEDQSEEREVTRYSDHDVIQEEDGGRREDATNYV